MGAIRTRLLIALPLTLAVVWAMLAVRASFKPWIAAGALCTLVLLWLGAVVGSERRRHRLMRSRIPGLAEFARSLGRDERDRAVVALFEALRKEVGPGMEYARGDDSMGNVWGIAGEDVDDLVEEAYARVGLDAKTELRGRFMKLETLREVLEVLEEVLRRKARLEGEEPSGPRAVRPGSDR